MPEADIPPVGLLEFYEGSLDFGRKAQAEHSKWLINTLYLLHSGSIAGIITRSPTDKLPLFVGSLSWFVGGVAFAFLAGLATWTNYFWFNRAYSDLIKSIRLLKWQAGVLPSSVKFVSWTQWLALSVGSVSFACLLIGASLTLGTLAALSSAK